MKVWIDGIDAFQLAVEQIMCCDWIVTFQSCPVQGLLACWPLTAEPRLELVAPALPCLCNFIVRSFQLTGFSNPLHIYCTRLLQNSFQAFKLSDNFCKPCLVSLAISAWFCCSCIKIWANIPSPPPAACGLPEVWAPPPGLIGEPLIADWGRSQTTYATDSLDSSAGIGLQLQTPSEWISGATACAQFSTNHQSIVLRQHWLKW